MPTLLAFRAHRALHRNASLLAAVLVVGACAGGGSGDTDGPVAPPAPAPAPSPPTTLGLTAAPAVVTVVQGESATAAVTLTRGGPAAAVTLGAAAPAGVSAALAPSIVPAGATESVVTLATTAATPAGDHTVTISGAVTDVPGGGANATTTLLLRVTPAPAPAVPVPAPAPVPVPAPASSYVLAVTPSPVVVTAGSAAVTATVTLTRSDFAGGVALAASGAPAGLTVTAPDAPVRGDAAALTVRAAATLAAGDYPVTVTGTAAGLAPVTAGVVVRVAGAAPPPSGVVVPSALLGDWTAGNPEAKITQRMRIEWFNGTPQYFVGRSAANWFVLTFYPDGRYEQLWYYLSQTGSCTAQSWKVVQGTATFGEGTFALTAASGRFKFKDDCVLYQYDRPMTAAELAGERRDHLWRFEVNPNNGRTYLMIGFGTAYTGDLVQLMFEHPR